MSADDLKKLKENESIKFIYKIPCSLYDDGFEYVVVGDCDHIWHDTRVFSIANWFNLIESGSLLPYVCSRLSRAYKVKEYLNIYKKPDLIKLRKYITNLSNPKQIIQESMWAIQYITEGKVNRVEVFKKCNDPIYAINEFYKVVEPAYLSAINKRYEDLKSDK